MGKGDRGPHQGVGEVPEISLFTNVQLSTGPISATKGHAPSTTD